MENFATQRKPLPEIMNWFRQGWLAVPAIREILKKLVIIF